MKLILCCDYGLDDALATVDALTHAQADGYTAVDIVAVAGNTPAEVSLANGRKLLAHIVNGKTPPVTLVDTTAISQPCEYLKHIHGEDGMGSLFSEKPSVAQEVPFDTWLKDFTGEFHLLSLGPMTLVPPILALRGLKKFIFMAGNVREDPNYGDYEFNHGVNPTAFAEAVKTPHVAITMDSCRNDLLNIQAAPLKGEGLLRKIANRAREMTFVSGEKGCYIWDDIAVKYLRHPDWFALEQTVDRWGNALTVAKYVRSVRFEDMIEE